MASRSPRRREILLQAGLPFQVRASDVPEVPQPGERPEDYVRRLSRAKALAVELQAGEIVLGADTVVVVDGEILEKPADMNDARRMLRLMSGRRHQVMTGLFLGTGDDPHSEYVVTEVTVKELTEAEIDWYTSTEEPWDKAGAYAIQGMFSRFVERVEGCFFNVKGLPIAVVYQRLRQIGLRFDEGPQILDLG